MTIASSLKNLRSSDYLINLSGVRSSFLKLKFIQLSVEDEDTRIFEKKCNDQFLTWKELGKDYLATFLKAFFNFSQTDANGFSGRGEMFVLSPAQLRLLSPEFVNICNASEETRKELSLLDVGAGDGAITSRFSPAFSKIVCTETSKYMRKQLLHKKFEVLNPEELPDYSSSDSAPESSLLFNCIFCLNVLDRCSKPISLLKQLRSLLKDSESILVLAIVLPWCPFVEIDNEQHAPEQILTEMNGYACRDKASFESSFDQLVTKYILPQGFTLVSWSKVPYISQGDKFNPLYTLTDAILILKKD